MDSFSTYLDLEEVVIQHLGVSVALDEKAYESVSL